MELSETKVLEISQIEAIQCYEKSKWTHLDSQEQELASWDVIWRRESLEYYLPLGWSFGVWEKGQLVGYCLTQPLLFFQKMTQSLWVEHIVFDNSDVGAHLVEVMVGWGRSKHIQKVLFYEGDRVKLLKDAWNFKKMDEGGLEVSTTKRQT